MKLKKFLWVFFISMVPIVELRGAVPIGIAGGMPWYYCIPICCIANMIPVPFILIFIKKILKIMKNIKCTQKLAFWIEKKADKNKGKVQKYEALGLLLFVGIPLPGTGAWTGSLVAALLDLDFKKSILSICGGVVLAGIIMGLASSGAVAVFSLFM